VSNLFFNIIFELNSILKECTSIIFTYLKQYTFYFRAI